MLVQGGEKMTNQELEEFFGELQELTEKYFDATGFLKGTLYCLPKYKEAFEAILVGPEAIELPPESKMAGFQYSEVTGLSTYLGDLAVKFDERLPENWKFLIVPFEDMATGVEEVYDI